MSSDVYGERIILLERADGEAPSPKIILVIPVKFRIFATGKCFIFHKKVFNFSPESVLFFTRKCVIFVSEKCFMCVIFEY